MAVNLDTRIPLSAIYEGLTGTERRQASQANELALRLNELKLDYENRKRKREADTDKYMGESLKRIQQGTPEQAVTDFNWNLPQQPAPMRGPMMDAPAYQQPEPLFDVQRRVTAPAVAGRQPNMEDMYSASIDALFRAGDYQGAFDAMKAMRSGQASQMKAYGGMTKTGADDGLEYAFNQATGQYEPTGFKAQADAQKPERPQMVRTAKGIEFVTPAPGMVLQPPPEPVKAEKPVKPMFTPSQLLDLNMKKKSAFKVLDSLDSSIAAYKKALESSSASDLMNPLSEQRTRIDSLATQLQMSYKTAAELGAITGPDWAIINRVIETPGIVSLLKGGVPKLLRQLDEVSNLSKRDRKILDEQYSVVPAVPGSVQRQDGSKKIEAASLPAASQYPGKIATDRQTGTRYKSDGKNWVRIP